MKNVITSLLLVFSLLLGMVSFSACTVVDMLMANGSNSDGNKTENGDDNLNGGQTDNNNQEK